MLRSNYDLCHGKSFFRHWTRSAIDCYNRGCACQGCITGEIIGINNCRMKECVIGLVKYLGAPPKEYYDILPGINENENNIIQAILAGAKTFEEIAQKTEEHIDTVKCRIANLYFLAESDGCKFKKRRDRLPELIEYILSKTKTENKDIENKNILKGETQMYDEDLKLKYPNSMDAIIDAVKKGYVTIKEIAKETGLTAISISTRFFEFANYLKKHGLILGNDSKSNRQRVIDFIQSRLLDNDYIEKPLCEDATPVTVTIEPKETELKVTISKQEYDSLINRIKELEQQPKFDFSNLKAELRVKITSLEEKLACIEDLEKELQLC